MKEIEKPGQVLREIKKEKEKFTKNLKQWTKGQSETIKIIKKKDVKVGNWHGRVVIGWSKVSISQTKSRQIRRRQSVPGVPDALFS